MSPSRADLAASLKSTVCPACGRGKTARLSLCNRCYFSLSRAEQNALFRFFGAGYEEAMAAALATLKAETVYLPEPAQEQPR